jgi:hypothetical protein
MKRLLFIFLIICLIFACSERSKVTNPDENPGIYTEIQGSVFGHLTIANSPYLVIDELIIEATSSLLIDPGVILHFSDNQWVATRKESNVVFISYSVQGDVVLVSTKIV